MTSSTPRSFGILDCTLRDGGYYTLWDFDRTLVDGYLTAMATAGITTIEIGYRSIPKQDTYVGEYFHLPLSTLEHCVAVLQDSARAAGVNTVPELAIMLNVKDCSPSILDLLLGDIRGTVTTVRLAANPAKLDEALDLAKSIKKLGFKVALNLMYLSRFLNNNDAFYAQLRDSADAFDMLNLVDSYGGCLPAQVAGAFAQYSKALPGVALGYHGHDNMSLALANAIAALENGATSVDATITGMGRGAGNLRTELALAYRNPLINWNSVGATVHAFEKLKEQYGWGTTLPYMISGATDLPQEGVMDLLARNRFTTTVVVNALRGITTPEKREYTQLSKAELTTHGEPIAAAARGVLILGGGATVMQHALALMRFAKTAQLFVVLASPRDALKLRSIVAKLEDNETDGASLQLPFPRLVYCLSCQKPLREGVAGDDNSGAALRRSSSQSSAPASPGLKQTETKASQSTTSPLLAQDAHVAAYVVSSPPRLAEPISTPSAFFESRVFQVDPITVPSVAQAKSHDALIAKDTPLGLALATVETLGAAQVFLAGFDGYTNPDSARLEVMKECEELVAAFRQRNPKVRLLSVTPTSYSFLPVSSVYSQQQALTAGNKGLPA